MRAAAAQRACGFLVCAELLAQPVCARSCRVSEVPGYARGARRSSTFVASRHARRPVCVLCVEAAHGRTGPLLAATPAAESGGVGYGIPLCRPQRATRDNKYSSTTRYKSSCDEIMPVVVEKAGTSTIFRHDCAVSAVSFVGHGLLATAAGSSVSLIDINTCETRMRLDHEDKVNAISVSGDCHHGPGQAVMATCSSNGSVIVWGVPSGEVLSSTTVDGELLAVALSHTADMLSAAGATTSVHLWDLPTVKVRGALGTRCKVHALAFAADNALIASGGADLYVRIWHTSTGVQLHALPHQAAVLALTFAPAAANAPPTCAAGGVDGRIIFWNVRTGALKASLERDATIAAIAFTPSGDLLAAGGSDQQVSLWGRGRRLVSKTQPLPSSVQALGFSKAGRQLACAAGDAVRLSSLGHLFSSKFTAATMGTATHGTALQGSMVQGTSQRLHRGSVCQLRCADGTLAERNSPLYHVLGHDDEQRKWRVRGFDGTERLVSEKSLQLCYCLLPAACSELRTYHPVQLENTQGACGRGIVAGQRISTQAPVFEERPFLLARESSTSQLESFRWRWRAYQAMRLEAAHDAPEGPWARALAAFEDLHMAPCAPTGVREAARQIAAEDALTGESGATADPCEAIPTTAEGVLAVLLRFSCNQFAWHSGAARDPAFAATALYAFSSRANHSCRPSMLVSLKEDVHRLHEWPFDVATEAGTILFSSMRDLDIGERLTYTYSQQIVVSAEVRPAAVNARRKLLQRANGFWCTCECCVAEASGKMAGDGRDKDGRPEDGEPYTTDNSAAGVAILPGARSRGAAPSTLVLASTALVVLAIFVLSARQAAPSRP